MLDIFFDDDKRSGGGGSSGSGSGSGGSSSDGTDTNYYLSNCNLTILLIALSLSSILVLILLVSYFFRLFRNYPGTMRSTDGSGDESLKKKTHETRPEFKINYASRIRRKIIKWHAIRKKRKFSKNEQQLEQISCVSNLHRTIRDRFLHNYGNLNAKSANIAHTFILTTANDFGDPFKQIYVY